MKTHLFSLFILISISTHLFAMDELFDIDQKQEVKGFVEWITEYKTPLLAGSIIGCGAAISLYKWDKRPVIISSAITGGYLVYKWLEDQENDETIQNINALKAMYGSMHSDLAEIKKDIDETKVIVTSIKDLVDDLNAIPNNIKQSKTIMAQIADDADKMKKITAELVDDSKELHGAIQKIEGSLIKTEETIKSTQESIRTNDAANWDKIFDMVTTLNATPNSSSIAK